MICVHHSKDLDGYTSGAVVRRKYPDCKLIGWDYGDPIPEFPKGEPIVLIDISFPMEVMLDITSRNNLTWIDHHISQKKEYDECQDERKHDIEYVYELGRAACEIGWKYFFPDEEVPFAVTLLGRYDTWRQSEGSWDGETLPFQFYMRVICTDPETFPVEFFDLKPDFDGSLPEIQRAVEVGRLILKYQEGQDMLSCGRGAFEREVYGGLRGICLNQGAFSSDTLKTVYNPEKHDVMIGFTFNKDFWRVSLRSMNDVDVSQIAKARGGGGHVKAAGFEVKQFEDIFK